ncbi:MAG: protease 2 [candidate division Zixibacteria bacterium SM23_81]|nr:MAG: protease 2 [candidate division Zixibacteria bacterium SM23_81]
MARVIPKADTLHGDVRIDNYHWLRERTNPEVIEYLEAENEYTQAMTKHTRKMQEYLFKELKGRIKETDMSVPEKIGQFYYYTRMEVEKDYPVYCRKRGNLGAEEEVLLDQNLLARGHDYYEIGAFKVSPDHRLLAYSVDTTGAEIYTVSVKDLQTGELLEDKIERAYDDLEWANDNETIFYSTLDEALRPYKLYRHTLGTDQSEDVLLYHERDEMFYLELSKTRSKAYIFIDLESKTTSEIRHLSADRPGEGLQVIHSRQQGMEYDVGHGGEKFYILTNDRAQNFKVMETHVSQPSKDNWQEVIPHREHVKIDRIDLFENHLVLYEREGGLKKIRVMNLRSRQIHEVELPEPVYTCWPERNPEFYTHVLRFNYSSLVTPRSVFDYDMNAKTRELKKQYEVLGGYDPSLYRSERMLAQAPDGTMVPISLVYKKGMVKDGTSPLYLDGYGSYGLSSEPKFSANRLSLINRGFTYAIAHIRGGGEMGRHWYEDGKLLNKMNTFTDFIACAEHLIAENYTSAERLVVNGESAGGLLMGAVANMRSNLFKIVIAEVPFVDVINTMLDPNIPLTVTEYEEWGNPNEREYYHYMKSYSPYDNVEAKDYPNMLITAGLNDPRVQYWEPAKWTAKLRALKTDDNILLLKTNMGAGHFGQTGRYDYLRDVAFGYAFIFDVLGIKVQKG